MFAVGFISFNRGSKRAVVEKISNKVNVEIDSFNCISTDARDAAQRMRLTKRETSLNLSTVWVIRLLVSMMKMATQIVYVVTENETEESGISMMTMEEPVRFRC